MKRQIIKATAIILLIIIISNVLLSSVIYADFDLRTMTSTDLSKIQTQSDYTQFSDSGTATGSGNASASIGGKVQQIAQQTQKSTNQSPSVGAALASMLGDLIGGIAKIVNTLMTSAVMGDATKPDTSFSIESLVFNKYELFDINVFNTNTKSEVTSKMSATLKNDVADWYASIRTLAIILSLVVLIYIAIRMATSTIAADQVKYKKMLQSWLYSFVLIFVLHYVIIIFIYMSEFLVDIFAALAGKQNLEAYLVDAIFSDKISGWETLLAAIMYALIVMYQVKFFILYSKRLLSNAFLILIAPIITVTYSIDKAGGHGETAFKRWGQEMTTNMLIQPLHALLVLLFFYSALEIAKVYPIIAIIFLFGLDKMEDLLRNLFKLGGSTIGKTSKQFSFTSLIR
ncbi:MAG: hypothetical protein FWF46_02795 [Oscillospiraceae bacterium]|nr:hypothetical protein [Oscillospiraceae bacterium]